MGSYVMQGEIYLDGKRDTFGPRTYSAEKALAGGTPDYVVFNGSVDALTGANAMRAKTGETVRLFFGVAKARTSSPANPRDNLQAGSPPRAPRWATRRAGRPMCRAPSLHANGAAIIEVRSDVPGRYSLTDSDSATHRRARWAT